MPTKDPDSTEGPRAGTATLIDTIRTLPMLPGSLNDLIELNAREGDFPERLRAVIERDPVLAAHVIRIANSSAFKGQAVVLTLAAAIHRVGAAMVVGNILQNSIRNVFNPYGGIGERLGHIATFDANLMMALATSTQGKLVISPDVAYLQGLLHDIGHLVMAARLGAAFEAFGHERIPIDELSGREIGAFGFDHQRAGRLLGNHWKLPDQVTVVIASHHFPRELRHGGHESTNTVIDLLWFTDRLRQCASANLENWGAQEAAIRDLLAGADAQKLIQRHGISAEEILAAIPAAIAGKSRDEQMLSAAS